MRKSPSAGTISVRALAVLAALGITAFLWIRWQPAPPLGPVDGQDLPGIDTGRVQVGDLAPDFRLPDFSGDVITLSEFRGEQDVVLAFYRGHW